MELKTLYAFVMEFLPHILLFQFYLPDNSKGLECSYVVGAGGHCLEILAQRSIGRYKRNASRRHIYASDNSVASYFLWNFPLIIHLVMFLKRPR